MPFDPDMRDPLTKVGLESIDPDIHQAFELLDVPSAGIWVGKVDISHTGLPKIPSISDESVSRNFVYSAQKERLTARYRRSPFSRNTHS
jgi:hypothetical protein